MDGNNAVVNVNYLLPAGNLYIVNYTIYPSGAVNVAARFTSTDMDAAQTEVSEATRTATFTPGRDAARKEASTKRSSYRCSLPLTGKYESSGIFRTGILLRTTWTETPVV